MLANVKDADGYTALHYASIKGHVRATEDLLSFGAQLGMKSNSKETVLHFAARCVACSVRGIAASIEQCACAVRCAQLRAPEHVQEDPECGRGPVPDQPV